jgi:hypothetical protein
MIEGRIIKDHPSYIATTDGRIYSLKRDRFLKLYEDEKGYLRVHIDDKVIPVHRLIAETFIPNVDNLETVDHIDEDKKNNSVYNLRWMSRGDNKSRSWSKQVMCVETGDIFDSLDKCAKYMGLDKSKICLVCQGKRNHTGGYTFVYWG